MLVQIDGVGNCSCGIHPGSYNVLRQIDQLSTFLLAVFIQITNNVRCCRETRGQVKDGTSRNRRVAVFVTRSWFH